MMNNKISIVELKSKSKFANFNGVQLKERDAGIFIFNISSCLIPNSQDTRARNSWTHVKEIANAGLLVSVNHN